MKVLFATKSQTSKFHETGQHVALETIEDVSRIAMARDDKNNTHILIYRSNNGLEEKVHDWLLTTIGWLSIVN